MTVVGRGAPASIQTRAAAMRWTGDFGDPLSDAGRIADTRNDQPNFRGRPEPVAAGALEVRAPKCLRVAAFRRRFWGSLGINPAKTQGQPCGVDSASFASRCRARATRDGMSDSWRGRWVGLGRDQELALEVLRVPAFAYPAHGGANCGAGSLRSAECQGPDRTASCHDLIYVRCRARICVGVPPSLPRHQRVNADCSENPTRPATSAIA